MIPRKLHQLYAAAFGYFWLPCPLCGRMFGGHEIGHVWVDVDGRMCCKRHYWMGHNMIGTR